MRPLDRRRFLQLSAAAAGVAAVPSTLLRTAAAAPLPDPPYGFAPPPATGVHPRVVLTPAELPALRTRVLTGQAQVAYTALHNVAATLGDNATSGVNLLLARLENGETLSWGDQETLGKAIAGSALVALVGEDEIIAGKAVQAFDVWVANIAPSTSPDFSRTTQGAALAYDWLAPLMDATRRAAARQWLVDRVTAYETRLENAVYGFKPGVAEQRNYNWIPHGMGAFGPAALAIEGETGFLDRWYDKPVTSMNDFIEWGIGPEGAPLELLHYFAYGMWQGSYFTAAMAKRGEPILAHPHLMNVPRWWTADLYPWGRDWGALQDTRDFWTGVPAVYHLLRLAYPDDPLMRWVYTNYLQAPAQQTDHLSAVLWASELEPSDLALTAASLDLEPSQFFLRSGLAYLRDDWGTDDVYFQFQSDQGMYGETHAHADRNSFTLNGKGRVWIIDGAAWFPFSTGHNLVMIDGEGQGYFPQQGHVLAQDDGGWAAGIMGDAKDAYDWRCAANPPDEPGWVQVNGQWSYPFNPVQRAFRTGTLVRGAHTYAVVSDDIRKDDAAHAYSWEALVPLGTKITQADASSWLLEQVDAGPFLQSSQSGAQPLSVPFSVATAGDYRFWVLAGREHTAPVNGTWKTSMALDGGALRDAGGAEHPSSGDAAQPHWLPISMNTADTPTALTAGAHTASFTPRGVIKHAALLVAPDGFDPTGPVPPSSFPAGSVLVRLSDLPAPTGWTLLPAATNPPRCLVRVLSPAPVTLTAETFRRHRTDNGENWGRVFRLKATTTTVEPRYRVLLYPHRAGDPLPAVTAGHAGAEVAWSGGVTDVWEFGTDPAFPAANGSSVRVTRGSLQFTLDVTLAALRANTERFVTDHALARRLTTTLASAERYQQRGRRTGRSSALDDYAATLAAAGGDAVSRDHAALLLRQAAVLGATTN
ncbi:hypothetical protein [Jiangella endophytica]|uniref:hypothetical protein n=1 Tax=Jiangella endophytica TaxID=1623398 RepID=UPI000E342853|nr:hypothetical protein [Jiangella endophytica]